MAEPYFLTGALGCIGAWVVKTLLDRGDVPVVFDLGQDPRRIRDVTGEAALSRVRFVRGDITDAEAVRAELQASGARKVIHLAGLQVPFCKADPALGARVNVLGTIHVFEAAKRCRIERVVYASSAAVYGPSEDEAAPDEASACAPVTHYGVYKRANEGSAAVYWRDDGVASVGLRPATVYGVGRDQGLTSGPTKAMKAAVLGRRFTIPFRGGTDYSYAGDTARAFVECADRAPAGAHVFNLHGDSVDVARIVELIDRCAEPEERGLVTCGGPELPIPPALDGTALRQALPGFELTPLETGVRETMRRFRELDADGRLWTGDLE